MQLAQIDKGQFHVVGGETGLVECTDAAPWDSPKPSM